MHAHVHRLKLLWWNRRKQQQQQQHRPGGQKLQFSCKVEEEKLELRVVTMWSPAGGVLHTVHRWSSVLHFFLCSLTPHEETAAMWEFTAAIVNLQCFLTVAASCCFGVCLFVCFLSIAVLIPFCIYLPLFHYYFSDMKKKNLFNYTL